MRKEPKEMWAYAGLTLMSLIIGFSFIFVKITLRHTSTADLLAHRFLIATIGISLFYILVRKKRPQIHHKQIAPLLLLSLFYPLLLFSTQTIGLKYTTASEAGILSATAPIITVIFAALILKEKTNLIQTIFVLLSVAGVVYIMFKNGLDNINAETLKGDFYIILSVISIGFYFVLGRKLNQKIDAIDITLFMSATAFIVFNIISLVLHINQGTLNTYFEPFKNTEYLLGILYLGILSTFITSFLTNNALTVIPASQVSVFNNMSPVIAIFAGVLFLDETLFSYHIVGGIMVLAGIIGMNVIRK